METQNINSTKVNKTKAFPKNAKFIIYRTNTKESIKRILIEDQKNWQKIKKIAPSNSYGFVLEDENHHKLPWFYILDWVVKTTNWMTEEDRYFDREANMVLKTIGECEQYVKTRILDLFLKFNPKTMKII